MRVCQRSRRGRPCSICRRSRRDWRSCRSRPIRPAREKAAPCPELSYYWLSLMIEVHQPVQRQLGLDTIEQVRLFLKKCRSEEHTSALQSLMRTSYAVFCLRIYKTIIRLQHLMKSM